MTDPDPSAATGTARREGRSPFPDFVAAEFVRRGTPERLRLHEKDEAHAAPRKPACACPARIA
jgi:hypothetical protein